MVVCGEAPGCLNVDGEHDAADLSGEAVVWARLEHFYDKRDR